MNAYAVIAAIEYVVPANVLTNEELAADFTSWSVEKIFRKTGIASRHIANADQCSSDLAVAAAQKLFSAGTVRPDQVDYVILCTQTPDYFLPTTACLIHHRLALPTACGAIDVNQGCSGYVYSLGVAKGLIESGQAANVLVLTAETYSKFINRGDRSVRTLFGDAAAATLVTASEASAPFLHSFVYGTDGAGADHLIVPAGGMRLQRSADTALQTKDSSGNVRSRNDLCMNGSEIYTFTLRAVPYLIAAVLEKARIGNDDIDFFVPHQANKFMLDALLRKTGIAPEKMLRAYEATGNTVSSTIPITLREAVAQGRLTPGKQLLLAGFGVGYSWGGCVVTWQPII